MTHPSLSHPGFDIVIVGLGVMGSACAAKLARAGARVLALDRHRPPHALGSSHGRSRIIREAYFEHERYIPLVRRSFALWRALEQDEGQQLLTICGALVTGMRESAFLTATLANLRAHGVPHEVLNTEEIRRRFPMLRPQPEMQGLYEPGAGVLDVEECVTAQIRAAQRAGAVVHFHEPLRRWASSADGITVETVAGTYRTDSLVLAAGPWVTELIPSLPLTVERQVQVWFSPVTPSACRAGMLPVFVVQTPSGGMMYGIPDQGAGIKAAFHHGGATGPLDTLDTRVSSTETEALRGELERFVPAAAGEVLDTSVCYYTNTPDEHFLIDRLRAEERVWVVSACSGHGFKFAPVVGELVGDWIATGRRDTALTPFTLGRFGRAENVQPPG